MKKTLITTLVTALLAGTATTALAANPFADVPADHWAHDAIARLAADGVVDGYGDGTYRGDQPITRYEVAQLVARAMAKDSIAAADKAALDKLAAEFSQELTNLGVRVAALEKRTDNVQWDGFLRYAYFIKSVKKARPYEDHRCPGLLTITLDPSVTLNKHWIAKTRICAYNKIMKTAENGSTVSVDRAYAEGWYGRTGIRLGKFPFATGADEGLVFDARLTGAAASTGNRLRVDVFAGRVNGDDETVMGLYNFGITRKSYDIQGIQVYNDRSSKVTAGAGYFRLKGVELPGAARAEDCNIVSFGAGYRFSRDLRLFAAWAHNCSLDQVKQEKTSASVTLKYKKMDQNKPGSYDLFTGYRSVSRFGSVHDTFSEDNWLTCFYNGGQTSEKFWELGGNYCIDKNITFGTYMVKGKTAGPGEHRRFTGFAGILNFLF